MPSTLYEQTLETYAQAKAPGTIKNRVVQAQLYLKFCVTYKIRFLHPSILDIAMYTRFLGNSFSAPTTIKNYLSGARSWISHHLGDTSAFNASEPSDVFKKVASSLNHVTVRAYALSSEDIRVICEFLDARPSVPLGVKPCILFGYASFLRASNLLSSTMSGWSGPHTLKAADVIEVPDGLCIIVRSTKTRPGDKPIAIQINRAASQSICPVSAWTRYKAMIRPSALGPAFLQNDHMPLTSRPIVALMRLALGSVGHPKADQVTMHSLRRGGVQCAAKSGASQSQLMNHGTWSSQAGLKPYITEDQRIIPQIIADSLA